MRYLTAFVVFITLLMSGVVLTSALAPAVAQTQSSAPERAASLRLQLNEVEAKQAELQTRLQELEESLKPENIEHSLAGVGSTRPEDLREQRRRQLEIERNGVRAQLDLLATSHTRLESSLARAEAEAYRQSAAPLRGPSIDTSPSAASSTAGAKTRTRPRRVRKHKTRALRR